ncbi:hypothetical protein HY639_03530 [Candidatus Woesearchaeota archaeon]|nr:hypothetical protein [Candidatus Woesearchaeota archaeon]
MADEYVPFMIRRTFNNPSRRRPNKFRIKFDRAIDGKGHEFSIDYEAPDEKTQNLLNEYVNAGSMGARPRMRLRNGKGGWEIVEPITIKE